MNRPGLSSTDTVPLPPNETNPAGYSPREAAPAGEFRQGEDAEPMLHCPVCSQKLLARKCKLYCAQCGYYMSCADYI